MDVQLETMMKQVADMQGLLSTLAKENGQKDGKPNADAIKKDELEKMKADIFVAIDAMEKKFAVSKVPPLSDDEKKKVDFGKWLLAVKHGDHEFLKTYMSEGDNAQGGYTVPTGQATEVYGALNNPATIIAKCTPFPHGAMDGFTKNIPKWLTNITIRWVLEAGIKSTTKPTIQQKQSILNVMYATIPFTDEYLADNTANMTGQIATLVGEGMNVEIERSVLAGNTDPFLGISYAVGVNAYPQPAANLIFQDLINITNFAMLEKYHVGAELYMTRGIWGLCMGLVDGSGRPIFMINSIGGAISRTILGIPVNISSQCVANHIIYGNFKNVLLGYKAAGVGQGIQVDISNSAIDADTTNYWTQNMTGYRFNMRRSVIVVNPEAFVRGTGIA